MGLLDEMLGGALLGFGAGMLAQGKLSEAGSAAGSALRPIAKSLVKGSLILVDQARTLAAEAMEQASDLVAEVQAERATRDHVSGRSRTRE